MSSRFILYTSPSIGYKKESFFFRHIHECAQRIGRAGLQNHAHACDTCSGVPGDQVFGERIAVRLLALSRRSQSSSTPLRTPDLRQQSAACSSCIGCTHSCIDCAFVRGTALRTSSCTEFVRLLQATYHGNWCEWSRRCLWHWSLRRVNVGDMPKSPSSQYGLKAQEDIDPREIRVTNGPMR